MRIRTILKAAAVPAIIAGGLLATSAGSAAHAATLTGSPASNGQVGHMTGNNATFYQDGTFGPVSCNETQHKAFDTVSCKSTTGLPLTNLTAGEVNSIGWNSDFGTASIHPATGALAFTVSPDGMSYAGQATYPPAAS
jgi:hypothetical protein